MPVTSLASHRTSTLLLVDIEAVKDKHVLADWPEDKWPPPVGWQVVAIGMLLAKLSKTGEGLVAHVEKSGCMTGSEDEIIGKFWEFFDRREPLLITWNGRGYDLPILRQRAFIRGVPTPKWFQAGRRFENYCYRYSADWHCDLMDQFSDYGACTKTSMDLFAKAMGLPGKIGGDGAEVETMFEAGEIEKLASYCECDVLNLYGIYLRWLMVTGQMGGAEYEESEKQLAAYLGAEEKSHHAIFLAKWDRRSHHSFATSPFRSSSVSHCLQASPILHPSLSA
jgi:predicted PolB exonuclease-like 3'-5' exonuclease